LDSGRPTVRAPFVKGGRFQAALRHTLNSFLKELQPALADNFSEWATQNIKVALDAYDVKIIPWMPVGRHQSATWDQWALVNVATAELNQQIARPPNLRVSQVVRNALNERVHLYQEQDATGPWSVDQFALEDLPTVMKRGCLPKWEIPGKAWKDTSSPDFYVTRTYEWVQEVFNIGSPSHYVALALGFIISKMIPYISFCDEQFKQRFGQDVVEPHQLRKAVVTLPWKKVDGLSRNDAGKVACSFIATAIAIVDDNSPLAERMRSQTRRGFGKPWNEKQGKRKISLFTLFRCSFLSAKGPLKNSAKQTKLSKFEVENSFSPNSEADYLAMALWIQRTLDEGSNAAKAVADVVENLLGKEATILITSREILKDTRVSIAYCNKRRREEEEEDEDEDEGSFLYQQRRLG